MRSINPLRADTRFAGRETAAGEVVLINGGGGEWKQPAHSVGEVRCSCGVRARAHSTCRPRGTRVFERRDASRRSSQELGLATGEGNSTPLHATRLIEMASEMSWSYSVL